MAGLTLEQDIALLSGIELLSCFDVEQLRLLAFGAQKRDLNAGEILYREHARSKAGYVIISGRIELVRHDDDDHKVVMGVYGPGSLIGELALITENERYTTAIATQETRVMRISRSIFSRVLEEFPDVAVQLHAQISSNIQDMIERLDKVGQRMTKFDT